jgi:hypothetical protein
VVLNSLKGGRRLQKASTSLQASANRSISGICVLFGKQHVSIAGPDLFAGMATRNALYFETGRGWFAKIVAACTISRVSDRSILWKSFWIKST